MAACVQVMRSIPVAGPVSLFDFCIGILIMGIVIMYLVNVARRPYVGDRGSRKGKGER